MMSKMLDIVKYSGPTSSLRKPSVDVTEFNREIRDFAIAMSETMFGSNGVGLAAPQVDRHLNMFVMMTDEALTKPTVRKSRVLINPRIISESKFTVDGIEGCLSIPGLTGVVERPIEMLVGYLDKNGHPCETMLSGLAARIFYHEFDHLNGTLFFDRATRLHAQ